MRCTRNDRLAEVRRRGRGVTVALAALVLLATVLPAAAQGGGDRASSLKMRDTAILGERPTPDIFFILPTGKGGNLSAPHRRDYSGEILEPVVKPWLEKDQNVTLAGIQHVSGDSGEWENALDSAPAPLPAVVPEPVLPASRREPAVEIPAAALSGSARPVVPPPSMPAQATSAPPPPPAAPPSAPAAPPAGSVPILVPPQ